ncbi:MULTISPECIES: hypothetical protein [unclassified Arthrobacter]|uniref:hypothetical protein n=1 Tax=unclassified Arthrobacter TaxID=235627 RepID=UPI002551A87B|nr:hypothetical protein [Arthrobacter sp. efr-133-TYG-120]
MSFTFPSMVTWDPNGKQNVKNVSFQVYAVTDTGFTTPLAITDTFNNPLPGNILNSGTQGVFPQFQQATNSTVVIADATKVYAWTINCVQQDSATASFITTGGTATKAALDGAYAATSTTVPKWVTATAYTAGQLVISPNGDVVSAIASHTSGGTFSAANWNLSPTYASFLDPASIGPMGIRKKTSSTYGTGYVFGTASSFGFSGTGTPADIAGAFGIYQEYGRSAPGANVLHTTQGGYAITNYWGPTTDDVAEGFSSACLLKDGGVPFTQNASTTALEGISQVENNVTVTGKTVAVSGRAGFKGTSSTAYGYSFYAQTEKDASASVATYVGFAQDATGGATNNFGVKVVDRIETQTSLGINPASGNGLFNVNMAGVSVSSGNTPFARVLPPSTSDFVSLRVGAAAGQTKNIQEWWPSGASAAQAYVDTTGAVRSRQGFFAHDSGGTTIVGLTSSGPKWYASGLQQSTVGAAGSAAALPAAPNKYLKVVDASGTTLVIPAYNA